MMNGLLYVCISSGVLKGPNNSDLPMIESYFSPKFELVGSSGLFYSIGLTRDQSSFPFVFFLPSSGVFNSLWLNRDDTMSDL